MWKCVVNIVVLLVSVLLPYYLVQLRTSWYVCVSSFVCGFVTLYVWPYLAFNMHRVPLYIEDIERTNDARLIFWFKTLLMISSSVGVSLVVEFAWERFHNDDDIRMAEVLGVLGGLLSLFSKIHMVGGKVLLTLFGFFRNQVGSETL